MNVPKCVCVSVSQVLPWGWIAGLSKLLEITKPPRPGRLTSVSSRASWRWFQGRRGGGCSVLAAQPLGADVPRSPTGPQRGTEGVSFMHRRTCNQDEVGVELRGQGRSVHFPKSLQGLTAAPAQRVPGVPVSRATSSTREPMPALGGFR